MEDQTIDIDKERQVYRAGQLLRLYGEYLRELPVKRIKFKPHLPKGYERPAARRSGLHIRSFARVAMEPNYQAYEPQLLAIYFELTGDPMAQERCSEFELSLDASLEKKPFVPDIQSVEEAKDFLDALVPVRTCAAALGVNVKTIHRWIEAGMSAQLHSGYPAVVKKGAYYWVNIHAASMWKSVRGRKFKKGVDGSRQWKKGEKICA